MGRETDITRESGNDATHGDGDARKLRHAILDAVASVACYVLAGGLLVLAGSLVGISNRYAITLLLDVATVAVLVRGTGTKALMPRAPLPHPAMSCRRQIALMAAAFVLMWLAGTVGSGAASLALSGGTETSSVAYSDALVDSGVAVGLALQLVVAPVAEEMLVRRRVYAGLRKAAPMPVAVALSAALFAGMHGTLVHIPMTLMLGAFLACAYEGTESLGACVALHAMSNAMTLALSAVESVPATVFLPVVAIALSAAAVAVICLFGKVSYEARREEGESGDGERTAEGSASGEEPVDR